MSHRLKKGGKADTPTSSADGRCACSEIELPEGSARKAIAVDPKIKSDALIRLRRIEGQVRGIQKMIADERYCADVLVQIAAVNEGMRKVARELLSNHLRHCAAHAIQSSPQTAEAMYDELLDLFTRYSK